MVYIESVLTVPLIQSVKWSVSQLHITPATYLVIQLVSHMISQSRTVGCVVRALLLSPVFRGNETFALMEIYRKEKGKCGRVGKKGKTRRVQKREKRE